MRTGSPLPHVGAPLSGHLKDDTAEVSRCLPLSSVWSFVRRRWGLAHVCTPPATMTSAKARSLQVRTRAFPAQPPDLHRFSLVMRASRRSFPRSALLGSASDPVSVRRFDAFFHLRTIHVGNTTRRQRHSRKEFHVPTSLASFIFGAPRRGVGARTDASGTNREAAAHAC